MTAAANASQLQKIVHKTIAAGSEEVVLSFNTVTEPKVFTMGGNQPRVVYDFEGVQPRSTLRNLAPGAALVKGVRVGIHRQDDVRTRLVFDVNSLQGLKHSYNVDKQNNRLVVRFSGPGAAAVAKEKQTQVAPARLQAGATKQKGPGQEAAVTARGDKDVAKAPVAVAARQEEKPARAATPRPAPAAVAKIPEERQPALPVARETAAQPEEAKTSPPQTSTPEVTAKAASPVTAQPSAETQPAAPAAAADTAPAATTPAPGTGTPDPSAAPTEAPYLSAIQFDPDSPRGELVQFKLNGFYPPVLRSIETGSPQVICEFSNLQVAPALEGPIKISGRLVKAIRLDKSADGGKVRVFVELEPNQNYDLQQVFFKEDNFFVLIVNTVKA
ncbi:MAG: AMIN domain-containing protein [Desulfobulbaceae bacterium]|nr:AMIN domain-containing protein [Desulfobulbaceae bacterium]